MEIVATVDDYIARYGDVDDTARVDALLVDVTFLICSQKHLTPTQLDDLMESDPVFAANARSVACAVVDRVISQGDQSGLSSMSEGVGEFSRSWSYASSSGDIYLTSLEKKRLGIGRSRVISIGAKGVTV